MNTEIVGRIKEQKELEEYIASESSEFIAIYGRRRVGKTFLVRELLGDNFAFYVTGMDNVSMQEQLLNFNLSLRRSSDKEWPIASNWLLAFDQLISYLESLPKGRKILFMDELPWMDTHKSGFISALEHFWNAWAFARCDIKLITCGSATSWMIDKLINNRAGLHNRLTHHMLIEPFTLHECELYFHSKGIEYSRYEIAECYMVMGGIPFYLSQMKKGQSVAQNIDYMFFEDGSSLGNEFGNLYRALFKYSEKYIKIVEALALKGKGLNRVELIKHTGLTNNGGLTTMLKELEACGFIRRYKPFGKIKKDALYQLMDFYTLFYFKFILKNWYKDEHFWTASLESPVQRAWSGYAFEMLCLWHIRQIKKALGISGVQSLVSSWCSEMSDDGAQIDIVIDRKDQTVNLCEMKYSIAEFVIDKKYDAVLRNKQAAFLSETKTRKSIHLTFVTTYGVKVNAYSSHVQSQVLLEDLFGEI
ncbi:ATP-binding protein [Bacteroides sp.]|uniref:AAA family ATPase n=1 Tax=Bacteroides sp. TaxID=29523 RepID=UPI002603542F|nr:ATP-binding protein [Bacteroides sp.]